MDRKGIILGVLLFFLLSGSVPANPIDVQSRISSVVIGILLLEAFMLACIFGLVTLRSVFLVLIWLGITFSTFVIFRTVFGSLYQVTGSWFLIVLGEVFVILIEAKAIQVLSRLMFSKIGYRWPLNFAESLGYSTLINIGSIAAGFLLL